MTMLAQYERARAALAEATKVEQVLSIRDELAHVKLYAKQIRDRALLADATEFQLRAERRLGVLLVAAKEAGQLADRGRRKAETADSEPPATLDEIGVDRKLSAVAQRHAALSDDDFDHVVQATRERITAGRAKIIEEASINGARAVMAGRLEPDDSLDYFPTPPWATRALFEHVLAKVIQLAALRSKSAYEPACGEGHIAEVLREYFGTVTATDIFDYGYGDGIVDYLTDSEAERAADWIITNPPFGDKPEAFLMKALQFASVGVALLVQLRWLETEGRYERIFRDNPPTIVAFFAERVPIHKGLWNPRGDTATAYIWVIWIKDKAPLPPVWIPNICRDTLTKPDDIERFTARPVRGLAREEVAA